MDRLPWIKCTCAECGITKTKFVNSTSTGSVIKRKRLGKLIEPSQAGGLLGEALLKGSVKGLFNLGRAGAAKAVKSEAAKQKIKEVANKYLIRLWIVSHQIYQKN